MAETRSELPIVEPPERPSAEVPPALMALLTRLLRCMEASAYFSAGISRPGITLEEFRTSVLYPPEIEEQFRG